MLYAEWSSCSSPHSACAHRRGAALPCRSAGGSTASPTHCFVGSRKPRKVFMPSIAFLRSVQFGSLAAVGLRHIEPVRSSTIMMSSGFTPQGEQAVERAVTLNVSIPSRPAKNGLRRRLLHHDDRIDFGGVVGTAGHRRSGTSSSRSSTTSGMSPWAFFGRLRRCTGARGPRPGSRSGAPAHRRARRRPRRPGASDACNRRSRRRSRARHAEQHDQHENDENDHLTALSVFADSWCQLVRSHVQNLPEDGVSARRLMFSDCPATGHRL